MSWSSDLIEYIRDNNGYVKIFAIYFKYYPYLEHKPSVLAVFKPIILYKDFGMMLFSNKGHILALNKEAAKKFNIRKELIAKKDSTNSLVIFDVFSNLKECLGELRNQTSRDAFFHLDFNVDAITKYIQITKVQNSDNIEEVKSGIFEGSEDKNENKSDYFKKNKLINMIANINYADQSSQDVYVMYFNVAQELTEDNLNNNATEFGDMHANSKTFTDASSNLSENSFLLNNETEIDFNNRERKSSAKKLNGSLSTPALQHKMHLVNLKKDSGQHRTNKKQTMLYTASFISITIGISIFILSTILTKYCNDVNDTLIQLNYKFSDININLWKTVYYVRRLDLLYKSSEFNQDIHDIYKEELASSINVFQTHLKDIIGFHHDHIDDNNPKISKVYIEFVLSSTKFSDRIYPVNAFLQYLTHASNVYNDEYRNFSNPDAFSALYFLIKNGMQGIYVS